MKKLIVTVFMLVMIPAAASASDFNIQLGAGALYNNIFQDPSEIGTTAQSVVWDDFSYGVDLRLNWGILQVSGFFIYEPGLGTVDVPIGIPIMLNVGVKFDIAMFSLGAGIGPNLYFEVGSTDLFDVGANLKLFADLNLGNITVSVSYFMMLNLDDWSAASALSASQQALEQLEGYVAVSVLYKF